MIQLNKEKKLDFSAILIVEGKTKKLFKRSERENFIKKVEDISDLAAKHEAMQTLDCLINGWRVEVIDEKINLYSSHSVYCPIWTIYKNTELISLLEELVHP